MKPEMESKLEPTGVTLARHWAEFRQRRLAWAGRFFARAKGAKGAAGHSLWFLLCLGIVLNLLSIAAPGYFGPDEYAVNFKVRGMEISDIIASASWFEFSNPRYTPLVGAIRQTVSAQLYDTPVLFLLSSVLFSVVNGVLLYFLVLRFSGQPRAALWSFLTFNLFPAATFVAGWVAATDKLYLTWILGIMHILLSDRNAALKNPSRIWPQASPLSLKSWKLSRPETLRQGGVAILFVLALMSKEFALLLPVAIGGLCLLVAPWRGWWWSLVVTIFILCIFLILRLDSMLAERPNVSPFSLKYVPGHVLSYWLYPFVWDNLFLHDVRYAPTAQRWFAGLLTALPVLFLLRRDWRFALAYLGYYYVFVAPVLIGESSYTNYLYGAAPAVAVLFAYVFRRSGAAVAGRHAERGPVRAVAMCLLAVLALHSAKLQWNFYEMGVRQQRAYTSLSAIVRSYDRRAGSAETKFAIRADSGPAWLTLYNSFWPTERGDSISAGNIGGLNLIRRVTVHHNWPGIFGMDGIPEGAVRLRMTPEGHLVEE